MVERVQYPYTLTHRKYDVTKGVSYDEDKEACSIATLEFGEAITEQCDLAYKNGWNGWNREDLCPIPHLVEKMKKAFEEGDVVKVGVYLMMLHGRGVRNFEAIERQRRLTELSEEITKLCAAEETVTRLDGDTSAHSKVLSDIRYKIARLDNERKLLLKLQG